MRLIHFVINKLSIRNDKQWEIKSNISLPTALIVASLVVSLSASACCCWCGTSLTKGWSPTPVLAPAADNLLSALLTDAAAVNEHICSSNKLQIDRQTDRSSTHNIINRWWFQLRWQWCLCQHVTTTVPKSAFCDIFDSYHDLDLWPQNLRCSFLPQSPWMVKVWSNSINKYPRYLANKAKNWNFEAYFTAPWPWP